MPKVESVEDINNSTGKFEGFTVNFKSGERMEFLGEKPALSNRITGVATITFITEMSEPYEVNLSQGYNPAEVDADFANHLRIAIEYRKEIESDFLFGFMMLQANSVLKKLSR